MWPFPSAKPLGWERTLNKGCISLIPTASQALTLFIDSLWDRGLLPSQGEHMGPCFRLMPWGPVTFLEKVVTPWPSKRNRSIHISYFLGNQPHLGAFCQRKMLNICCVVKFKEMATVELVTTEPFQITSKAAQLCCKALWVVGRLEKRYINAIHLPFNSITHMHGWTDG